MDKRKIESQPANLWDYRHTKLLLDVLALKHDYQAEEHLRANLSTLCNLWDIKPVMTYYNNVNRADVYGWHINIPQTLQVLAQHCLEHGRNEVQQRVGEE